MTRIGLDFDGVICDIDNWIEINNFDPNDITSEVLENLHPKELRPIDGAFEVIETGLVKSIITNRPRVDPVKKWFSYWYGPVPVPVRTARYSLDKGLECYRLRINYFVDNEEEIIREVREWSVKGILFNYKKHGNLFNFLKRKGVLT